MLTIENVNVHIYPAPQRSPLFDAMLSSIVSRPAASGTADAAASVKPPALVTPPPIGQVWPGQGGIYAGLSRGEDGAPDAHLILAAEKPSGDLAWQAGLDWAKTISADGHTDFHVPTRFESALLYANLRDQFDTGSWHWTSTQYSDYDAWGQYFSNGSQNYDLKKYEGAVRAVRRFIA